MTAKPTEPLDVEAIRKVITTMRASKVRGFSPNAKLLESAEALLAALDAEHSNLGCHAQLAASEQAREQLRAALDWARRKLSALVTEDDGNGAFIRGTGTELAGFGAGMDRIKAALRAAGPRTE